MLWPRRLSSCSALVRRWLLKPRARVTLAVLPFRALDATPAEDLPGNGVADTLLQQLSLAPRTVVRSSSVLRYARGIRGALPASST